MTVSICIDCGFRFHPQADWAKRCIRCWKAYKAKRGELCERTDPRLPAADEWVDMLPRLIRLAHPDRHSNSEMANKATAWLIDQRRRLEGERA